MRKKVVLKGSKMCTDLLSHWLQYGLDDFGVENRHFRCCAVLVVLFASCQLIKIFWRFEVNVFMAVNRNLCDVQCGRLIVYSIWKTVTAALELWRQRHVQRTEHRMCCCGWCCLPRVRLKKE